VRKNHGCPRRTTSQAYDVSEKLLGKPTRLALEPPSTHRFSSRGAVLALIAVGLSAGRRSGNAFGSMSVPGPRFAIVKSVKTGALIRCDGGVGGKVPPPGHGVSCSARRSSAALSAEIELKRLQDG
jgi:hypothetical protein